MQKKAFPDKPETLNDYCLVYYAVAFLIVLVLLVINFCSLETSADFISTVCSVSGVAGSLKVGNSVCTFLTSVNCLVMERQFPLPLFLIAYPDVL